MKDAKDVNEQKLREAIGALNSTGILENKIVVKGKTVDDLMDEFIDGVESVEDGEATELPEKAINMYNELIADEVAEEEAAKEVAEEAAEGKPEIIEEDEKIAEEAEEEGKPEETKPVVAKAETKEGAKKKGKGSFAAKKDTPKVLACIADMVSKGKYTRKHIIEKTMAKFPDRTESAISTYVTDGGNPKYCKFDKLIKKNDDGSLYFVK